MSLYGETKEQAEDSLGKWGPMTTWGSEGNPKIESKKGVFKVGLRVCRILLCTGSYFSNFELKWWCYRLVYIPRQNLKPLQVVSVCKPCTEQNFQSITEVGPVWTNYCMWQENDDQMLALEFWLSITRNGWEQFSTTTVLKYGRE